MKVFKYLDFINEGLQDPPEEWIKNSLLKIKKKIEKIFGDSKEEEDFNNIDGVKKLSDAIEDGKVKKEGLSNMGVELTDISISNYSSEYDSLKVVFTDGINRYDLYLTIPLKVALDSKKKETYDIKNCYIKFKKYNDDFELVSNLPPKKIKIDDINEDLFIQLKIDVDEDSEDSEELSFE